MASRLEKIKTDIEAQKEIISALPINTKKNRIAYVERLKEIKEEYKAKQKNLLEEITKEYEAEMDKNLVDESLNKKLAEIKEIEKIENAIDNIKTPYEKMKLDKSIHNLKRFYKKNLETVNEEIKKCIELFEQVGIILTVNDFNFTPYVHQYMGKIFSELKKEEFDSDTMKREFEEIYWKSPKIITNIQMNIRYIYLKNENAIAHFYKEQVAKVKDIVKTNVEEIENNYKELKIAYLEESKKQRKLIIDDFANSNLSFKDYDDKVINKTLSKYISLDKFNENKEEAYSNLINLLHNLYEYRSYLKFKYLFEDVKDIYQKQKEKGLRTAIKLTDDVKDVYWKQKEKGKGTYASFKKQIIKKGDSLSANSKFTRENQQDKKLQEMEVLCEQLDAASLSEKIQEVLNEKSNVKEMSRVIVSFYKYLFMCIINNNKDITEPEIMKEIEEFEKFSKYPYNVISESITMIQEKNIPLIIKDRYSLFDIKITVDTLDESNIEIMIADLERIENIYYINKSGMTINYIEALCKMKNVIDSNK